MSCQAYHVAWQNDVCSNNKIIFLSRTRLWFKPRHSCIKLIFFKAIPFQIMFLPWTNIIVVATFKGCLNTGYYLMLPNPYHFEHYWIIFWVWLNISIFCFFICVYFNFFLKAFQILFKMLLVMTSSTPNKKTFFYVLLYYSIFMSELHV